LPDRYNTCGAYFLFDLIPDIHLVQSVKILESLHKIANINFPLKFLLIKSFKMAVQLHSSVANYIHTGNVMAEDYLAYIMHPSHPQRK